MTHHSILAVAPNGAYKQKAHHPALPLSLDEIVQCAIDSSQTGSSFFHLHIRDQANQHSLDADTYLRTIEAIKDEIGNQLIIQITSESGNRFAPADQIKSIKAVNPEIVSIALRELIPDHSYHLAAQALLEWCAERKCRIQYILYNEDELLNYFDYVDQGFIPCAPHSVLFVLGRYQEKQSSSAETLMNYLNHQQSFIAPWMVCAFGASEQSCLIEAAKQGGHMRQGFENNILSADGSLSKSNTQQLQDTALASQQAGIKIANVKRARELLSIR